MWTLQHQMSSSIYELFLLPCPIAPQKKDNMLLLVTYSRHNGIRKLFPPLSSMGSSLPSLYCQCSIEQKHALLRPGRKVSAYRHLTMDIILQFLKYILERRRQWNAGRNRKTQSHRLNWFVIGILSQNNYLCILKRT